MERLIATVLGVIVGAGTSFGVQFWRARRAKTNMKSRSHAASVQKALRRGLKLTPGDPTPEDDGEDDHIYRA
jgi:hypothetical protein